MLILVASTASYSDAWMPFTTLFERFWPDCPYRKVLFSDAPDVMPKIGGFEFLTINDAGWNMNLLRVLERQSEETVAVFQEDFFVCYPVKTAKIKEIDDWIRTGEYACCRLYPCPGGDETLEVFPGVGEITGYAPYRASCQVAIWKRTKLIELLNRLLGNGYGKIQDFELQGSRLIDDFKLCGIIRQWHPETWPLCYHCSAIAAGKWMQGAVKFCQEQGVPLSKRPILFASAADEAILRGGYYEWLEKCASGQADGLANSRSEK